MNNTRIILLVIAFTYLKGAAQATNLDTTKKLKPKLYSEIIDSSAKTYAGLFKVHKVNSRYYFEIENRLFDKEMLVITRIYRAPAGTRINIKENRNNYAGDQVNQRMIRFSRFQENNVYITTSYETEREISSDSSENGLYRAIQNNSFPTIVAAFEIKAYSPDSMGIVIDVTDYLNGDNDIFFFNKDSKVSLSLGSYHADKSFINVIQSTTSSVNIRSVKTYLWGLSNLSTYELSSSIVMLPSEKMKTRYYDERVGYFPAYYFPLDFDINPQGVDRSLRIARFRMEPKLVDIEKYMKGILVEPERPIVFYIDPATPKKWIPYLKNGVNAWQKAFEKAGFKNAIYAEEITEDHEIILNSPEYNVIFYKPSDAMNASGPNIHDPRTGEILSASINWYHNVMQVAKDWYFLQVGAIEPQARELEYSDSLMGKIIQYICSHEIGHTLGLAHNFGASSTVNVDSLRNKQWVETNGICPSIMDYARFNYVAQPGDHISEQGLFPRIGAYDEWAIEYGYRWFIPFKNFLEEKAYMTDWVTKRLQSNKYLWFGNENGSTDPRRQAEDLGNDPVKASYYGIKNLKIITLNLIEWTKSSGGDYEVIKARYNNILDQYNKYLSHVSTIIGGVEITPKTIKDEGDIIKYTSKTDQKAALKFLNEKLFTTPLWIANKEIYAITAVGGVYRIANFQKLVIEKILSHTTLGNMLWSYTYKPAGAYKPQEFLRDLNGYIWKELGGHSEIDIYRRNLQKIYVEHLISLLSSPKNATTPNATAFYIYNQFTDVSTYIKSIMQDISQSISKALQFYRVGSSKMHLLDVRNRLDEALKVKD